MARIRYLKPDFFKDEDIAELPHQTRLFFAGLWNYADRAGRLEDRPKRLKVEIFPYERADVEKMLQLLAKPKTTGRPFIQRYEVNGNKYIQITTWQKHQKPHSTEKESEIPPPPPYGKENGDGEGLKRESTFNNAQITHKEPLKSKHLDFVLLTAKEYQNLCDLFGESQTKSLIEKLNNYIGSKGKKYKSHYFTILNWAGKDGIRRQIIAKKPEYLKDFKEPNVEEQKKVSELVKSTIGKMGQKK